MGSISSGVFINVQSQEMCDLIVIQYILLFHVRSYRDVNRLVEREDTNEIIASFYGFFCRWNFSANVINFRSYTN